MILKLLLLSLILIHYPNQLKSNEIEENKHCLIHNLQYSREYLYASKNTIDNKDISSSLITFRLDKVDDFIKITWVFVPVIVNDFHIKHMNKSLYLIKSGQSKNEYLCSTNEYEKISPNRRLVKLFNIKETEKFQYYNCFWNFEKIFLNKTIKSFKELETAYVIRNMLVNEPMYAGAFFFNSGWYKRSVFLWVPNKGSSSNKFKWIIDCSKGEYIYSK